MRVHTGYWVETVSTKKKKRKEKKERNSLYREAKSLQQSSKWDSGREGAVEALGVVRFWKRR